MYINELLNDSFSDSDMLSSTMLSLNSKFILLEILFLLTF